LNKKRTNDIYNNTKVLSNKVSTGGSVFEKGGIFILYSSCAIWTTQRAVKEKRNMGEENGGEIRKEERKQREKRECLGEETQTWEIPERYTMSCEKKEAEIPSERGVAAKAKISLE